MSTLNGYSYRTAEVITKWISGYYLYNQIGATCPWITKTLRLAKNTVGPEGVGFDELVDSPTESSGYEYYEFPDSTPFIDAAEGSPNYNPYIVNKADIAFSMALLAWDPAMFIGMFGQGGVATPTDPYQFILGFGLVPSVTVGAYQQLVFLAGNFKIALRTPYYVA